MDKKDKTFGIPIIVSGPSGVGKGTVIRLLLETHPELVHSISMTTRPPRPGEQEGADYFFVSRERFEQAIAGGELVEWAQVYGNYYGTPTTFLENHFAEGVDVVLDIDVQGAAAVRSRYRNRVLLFLLPPSLEILKNRLLSRVKGQGDDLDHRFAEARREIRFLGMFDYLIINDNAEQAADDLYAVIRAHRLQRERMEPVLANTGIISE